MIKKTIPQNPSKLEPKFNDTAINILNKRYLIKDEKGNVSETPSEMLWRVAYNIATADGNYTKKDKNKKILKRANEFYEMMANLEFLPNSPTLMNAGNVLQQLSACFCLPINDSMESIFETLKNTAMIFKAGGGCGYNFSHIRPSNDLVKSTSGTASGPISFMEVYNSATEVIKQGGKRRGAQMAVLNVSHPDIMDFIKVKSDLTKLTNFNLSIAITDVFMEAVKNDTDYDIINPRNKEVVAQFNARKVFKQIVKQAWTSGEPGLIFIDEANRHNATPHLGKFETTNPCITGDTLVHVADGRNSVSMKQLLEEGEDVPVYCTNNSDKIFQYPAIRMMRNIRKTGNKQIIKLTINDKYILRVSDNHKMHLYDGSKIEAQKLMEHDRLSTMIHKFDDTNHQVKLDMTLYVSNYIDVNDINNPDDFDIKKRNMIQNQEEHIFRITKVETDGYEDVYNGTVDEFHNYTIGCFSEQLDDKNLMISATCDNCGEQLLFVDHETGGGESCNLGSINISKCYDADGNREFVDYNKLDRLVKSSIHFLDNVIDMNNFPLDSIEKMTKDTRRVGLGIMGFSDLLLKLKIPYSSKKAIDLADELMKFINEKAYEYSIQLGKERGIYPVYKKHDHLKMNEPCRNAARTTIAPTGTISILADCSSGIEPIFSLAFVRNIMDDDKFFEVNPIFEDIAKKNNFYSDNIIQQLAKDGTVHNIEGIPDEHKKYLESAHDISPVAHIATQSAFQKHIDSSISKTVNFSKDATIDDVENAYMLAYASKCKGITIYRDGSRDNQVLNIGDSSDKKEVVVEKRIKKNRPKKLQGSTYEYMTGCGKIFITINEDSDGMAFEMFSTIGKAGGCASSNCEAIGRLTSLALRSGQTLEPIIKQLSGIRCHMPLGFGANTVLSCSDAIAQAMKFHFENQEGNNKIEINDNAGGGACPDCGGAISHEGGCQLCRNCGFSLC